ncbi:DegT/DnrJ/EryC1/StrS family aminotransferase [bacterium]|nr:DegT/DnrJ/EryC1/StrS family aminotransferase [bacterium]
MPGSHQRAQYGAAAIAHLKGQLPNPFPRAIGPNAMGYLQEVVDSGLTSDMVTRFETAFARALGVKHCISTPGCTPALAILAAAFPFEPGDEIIVNCVTDYGTIQGLFREGYIPVFADTAPGTINMSADTIAPLITDRTRGLLCVHKTGLMCDMDPILALADRHGLIVYEDACQGAFSTYKGRLAGTIGRAAGFSFDSEKTLGSDVGGCVVTDDDALAERLRFIGHSRGGVGKPGYGRLHTEPGYAFRMTQSTAAITLAQLEIIGENVATRDRMARLLTDLLDEIPGVQALPIPPWQEVYSCWMFGFTIEPERFACDTAAFAAQLTDVIPAVGMGAYYLMPEACTFLEQYARAERFPFSRPPASRTYHYGADSTPVAAEFLQRFIRWATLCEKYTEQHCEIAAAAIRAVADANRR